MPFALVALVDGAVSIVRSLADKKRLTLEATIDAGSPPFLIGDAARIRQVLLNLLNNAIKFTVRGGIKLKITCDGVEPGGEVALRFRVEDTGIGIPESKFDRLFKRFSQVDNSITRDFGGTGLGLAISQNFIELMGGTIGVESHVGEGSTFWFRICLPPCDTIVATFDAEPATPMTRARVLLVEDLELNQQLAKASSRRGDTDVTIVSDGVEAVMAVQQEDYDVILMDLQMPRMDGLTATRHIRALDHRARSVPIIAMTANVLPAQIEQMREAGMDDHVGKPFKRDQLHAAIKRALCGKVETEKVIMDNHADPSFDQATFDDCADAVGMERIGRPSRPTGDFHCPVSRPSERRSGPPGGPGATDARRPQDDLGGRHAGISGTLAPVSATRRRRTGGGRNPEARAAARKGVGGRHRAAWRPRDAALAATAPSEREAGSGTTAGTARANRKRSTPPAIMASNPGRRSISAQAATGPLTAALAFPT